MLDNVIADPPQPGGGTDSTSAPGSGAATVLVRGAGKAYRLPVSS